MKLIDPAGIRAQYEVVPYIRHVLRVCLLFLAVTAVAAVLVLCVLKHRRRLLVQAFRWLAARNWSEIVLLRVPLASFVFGITGYLYMTFKMNFPSLAPFSWDQALAMADRALFFGVDPWVLSHSAMPAPVASGLMDLSYILWFLELQLGMFAVSLLSLHSPLRLTFLTAYCLNWLVAGVVIAMAFSSAGPVYMERLTGDSTFAPLMERLYAQSTSIRISALGVQEWLWEGLVSQDAAVGGISAFPSLHVGFAVTIACLGFAVSRALGLILAAFAAINFVATVHLGWHYAVDGLAGAGLAVIFWLIAGRISDWWLAVTGERKATVTELTDGRGEARL